MKRFALAALCAVFLLPAFTARPASAAVPGTEGLTINSITLSPSTIPATGGAYPVFVDCTNAGTALPTGTATLTDSSGTVISQNSLAFFDYDSAGNPVLYTYLVFQPDTQPTGNVTSTISVTVLGQSGQSATGSLTATQSHDVPITIASLTASPNVPASSASVQAALGVSGPNQSGFYNGVVTLSTSSGTALDIEPLFGPNGTDGSGNPMFSATVGNIPPNTSGTPQVYTITLTVKDNAGLQTTATAYLTVPSSRAATTLTVVNGTAGQACVQLTQSSNGHPIKAHSVIFTIGASTSRQATDGNGVAACANPAGVAWSAAFTGSPAYAPSNVTDAPSNVTH